MITPDEFGAWKDDIRTKEVFKGLTRFGDEALETMLGLIRTAESTDRMVKVSHFAGYIEGISQILELAYEDLGYEERADDTT